MSRLVVVDSVKGALASRHEWDVVLDAAHPERGLDPSVLLSQVGAVASALASEAAGGAAVHPASIEHLELLAPVSAGERLIVTAAVEPRRERFIVVTLVARRRRGTPGAIVICGSMRFSTAEIGNRSVDERPLQTGRSPMSTTFTAKVGGDEALFSGNVVPWVQSSALVSAQGVAGAPVTLVEVESLSVLSVVRQGEALTLNCSVVKRAGDLLTVLSVVRSESRDVDVLAATLTFRQRK